VEAAPPYLTAGCRRLHHERRDYPALVVFTRLDRAPLLDRPLPGDAIGKYRSRFQRSGPARASEAEATCSPSRRESPPNRNAACSATAFPTAAHGTVICPLSRSDIVHAILAKKRRSTDVADRPSNLALGVASGQGAYRCRDRFLLRFGSPLSESVSAFPRAFHSLQRTSIAPRHPRFTRPAPPA